MTTDTPSTGIGKRLGRYFVAGLLTFLPLAITIVAISWVVGTLAGFVGPDTFLGSQLSDFGLQFAADATVAYALGWLSLIVIIFIVGFLVESGMREMIGRMTEGVLRRVPLVGKVYSTSQQLVSILDSGGEEKLKGMSVVYCSFGGQDGVGVLALLPKNEIITIRNRQYYVVLVPQSPVPIGGGLLFMPADSVQHVDLSVDALMSIYVSMGVVAPETLLSESTPEGQDA